MSAAAKRGRPGAGTGSTTVAHRDAPEVPAEIARTRMRDAILNTGPMAVSYLAGEADVPIPVAQHLLCTDADFQRVAGPGHWVWDHAQRARKLQAATGRDEGAKTTRQPRAGRLGVANELQAHQSASPRPLRATDHQPIRPENVIRVLASTDRKVYNREYQRRRRARLSPEARDRERAQQAAYQRQRHQLLKQEK